MKRLYPPLYRLACNIKDEKVPISIQVTALVRFSLSTNFLPFSMHVISAGNGFHTGMLMHLSQYLECVLGPGLSGGKVDWWARSLIGADLLSSTAGGKKKVVLTKHSQKH